MELRIIRNQRDYRAALKQAEALWNSPEGPLTLEMIRRLAVGLD